MTNTSTSNTNLAPSSIRRVFCARDTSHGSTFTVVELFTTDGKRTTVVLPRGEASNKSKLRTALMDAGIPHQTTQQWNLICQQIWSAPVSENAQVVSKTGWHGRQFVRPDGRVLGDGNKLVLHPNCRLPTSAVRNGNLDGWANSIAAPARSASSIAFTIGVAFAACLLGRVPGVQSGIFHLFGHSSQGKTTGVRAANSVSFNGNAYETWDKTGASYEERLAQRSGSLSTIDEIERVTGTPSEVFRIVRQIAFLIEGARGRSRSRTYAPQGDATWLSLAISTGEYSITSLAERAALPRTLGDIVRLIDVPAVIVDGKGLFDRLTPNTSSALLRDQIEQASAQHYGVAAEEFISRFITDDERHLHHINRWMEAFQDNALSHPDGWETRFSSRFAFVYAATRLAAKFEILPWDKDFILSVVLGHYTAARKVISTNRVGYDELVSHIISKLGDSDRFAWDYDVEPSMDLADYDGFMRNIDDDLVYLVKPDSMRRWFGASMGLEDIGRRLLTLGILLTDDRGLPTKQVSIRGIPGKPRYYCFPQLRLLES